MKRTALATILALTLALALATAAAAQSGPQFHFGFKTLAEQIPAQVGQPVEDEHYNDIGDSIQQTSKGMMVWRKSDNWTAFTNGDRTWINGPYGVQERANGERFTWEGGPALANPAPDPIPTDTEWRTYDKPEYGFSIKVPATWAALPLREQAPQGPLAPTAVRFIAADASIQARETGFATNVVVTEELLPEGMTMASYIKSSVASMERSGLLSGQMRSAPDPTASVPTHLLRYQVRMSTGGQLMPYEIFQWIVVRDRSAFVVTLTTAPDLLRTYTEVMSAIGASFIVKEPVPAGGASV